MERMSTPVDIPEKLRVLVSTAEKQNLIQRAAFEMLIEETSPEVVSEILSAFKITLEESRARLMEQPELHSNDLHKVFHKLKGSALLLGFQALGDSCAAAMGSAKNLESKKDTLEVLSLSEKVLAIVKQATE